MPFNVVIFLLYFASTSVASTVYIGNGGCDVSDADCESPPAPLGQQINVFRQGGDGSEPWELLGNYTTRGKPSWVTVSPDNRCLFATLSDISRVVSYERMSDGTLEPRADVPSGGRSPVHLDHASDGVLLVANYDGPDDRTSCEGGATLTSLLVGERCALTPANSLGFFEGSGIDPAGRQACSHVHSVVVDPANFGGGTAQAFVQDLGADKIYTVRVKLTDGTLKLHRTTAVAAGTGPRHLVVYPSPTTLRRAYLVQEMGNLVSVYRISRSGNLSMMQALPTISDIPPGGFSKAAAIAITPDGASLFASNRGYGTNMTNTVTGYEILRNGKLAMQSTTSTEGRYPRGMELSPDGTMLYVAGQGSGNVVSFAMGGKAGTLEVPGATVATGLPVPTAIAFGDEDLLMYAKVELR